MGALLRSKFWVGVGVVALASVLVFLLGAMPMMQRNHRRLGTLSSRADELERILREGAKNEQEVRQQKEIADKLQQQYQELLDNIRQRDALLERRFSDPESGREGPLESGRWKIVYERKMAELRQKLLDSVVLARGSDLLVQRQLGAQWLAVEQMHGYEKEYWIQEAIVDAIAELNAEAKVVPVFDRFAFTQAPERHLVPSHETDFSCAAFELRVQMEFEFLMPFLKKLLEAPGDPVPLGIEITSVRVSRAETRPTERGVAATRLEERGVSGTRPILPGIGAGHMMPPSFGEPSPGGIGGPGGGMWGLEAVPPSWEPTPSEERGAAAAQAELPDKMVTVVVRGYVPDYIEPRETEKESEGSSAGGRIGRSTTR